METSRLQNVVVKSVGQVFLGVLILNSILLIAEIIKVDDFKNFKIEFKHGYFKINDVQVGCSIFSNILTIILLIGAFTAYRYNKSSNVTVKK